MNEEIIKNEQFRIIEFQRFKGSMNMAIDETILKGIAYRNLPPTIRIYGWKPSCVSIGYFQGLEQEIDIEKCNEQQVDIIRRPTGGGAVYHDYDGEITYSIIAPEYLFEKNIVKSYEQICKDVITALDEIGIKATFQPINDIATDGKKISGNAQTRKYNVLLQHGTILYTVDVEKMFSLLKVGEEKIKDKLIQSVKKRVTSVQYHSKARFQEVCSALITSFSKTYNAELQEYTQEELEQAKSLAKRKYESDEWTRMR